jgi:hypothetical protein
MYVCMHARTRTHVNAVCLFVCILGPPTINYRSLLFIIHFLNNNADADAHTPQYAHALAIHFLNNNNNNNNDDNASSYIVRTVPLQQRQKRCVYVHPIHDPYCTHRPAAAATEAMYICSSYTQSRQSTSTST